MINNSRTIRVFTKEYGMRVQETKWDINDLGKSGLALKSLIGSKPLSNYFVALEWAGDVNEEEPEVHLLSIQKDLLLDYCVDTPAWVRIISAPLVWG